MLLLLVSRAISAEVIAEYGRRRAARALAARAGGRASKVVFAITEPDAGSNTHQLRDDRHAATVVTTGCCAATKYYISGVDEAEALLWSPAPVATSAGRARLSLFVVPTDAPGLTKHARCRWT